jgi:hypothetical protein
MGVGAFTDKKHKSTAEDVLHPAGSKRLLWQSLIHSIANHYQTQGDYAFYGKNYGWALRFRRGGKALLSMYPGKDNFTVQIVLGQLETERASSIQLGRNTAEVLKKSHAFREGRWLFIKIESKQDILDVQNLLRIKSPPKRRRMDGLI